MISYFLSLSYLSLTYAVCEQIDENDRLIGKQAKNIFYKYNA